MSRKNNIKRAGMIAALAVTVASVGAAGSYAFFSDRTEFTNDFTTGSLDLKVTETLWENGEDGENMYPGYTVNKNPTVANKTGLVDNDAYIEAFIHVKDASGNPITDSHRLDLIYAMIRYDGEDVMQEGTKYAEGYINSFHNYNQRFELQTRDDSTGTWTYFLKDKLVSTADPDKGDTVTLFNKIVVPLEWSQTELDVIGDFSITVEFQGIQAATFSDVYEAMRTLNGIDIHTDYIENDENRPSTDRR